MQTLATKRLYGQYLRSGTYFPSPLFMFQNPASLMHVWSNANQLMCVCLLARSPVFSHLSSSLQGLSTIRAFKVQQRFQQMFDEYQDLHSGEIEKNYIFKLRVITFYRTHSKPFRLMLNFSISIFRLERLHLLYNLFICVCWQRPGFYSWLLLAGLPSVLMEFAQSLSPSLLLAAFTSGMVRTLTKPCDALLTCETWWVKLWCIFTLFSGLEPGAVGLALSYAVTLTGGRQTECRDREHGENIYIWTLNIWIYILCWDFLLPKDVWNMRCEVLGI